MPKNEILYLNTAINQFQRLTPQQANLAPILWSDIDKRIKELDVKEITSNPLLMKSLISLNKKCIANMIHYSTANLSGPLDIVQNIPVSKNEEIWGNMSDEIQASLKLLKARIDSQTRNKENSFNNSDNSNKGKTQPVEEKSKPAYKAIQPKTQQDFLNYFNAQSKKFNNPTDYFSESLDELNAFDLQIEKIVPPKNPNKPSLEEAHELFHNIKEFKKRFPADYKPNKDKFESLKDNINIFCEKQYSMNNFILEGNSIKTQYNLENLGKNFSLKDLDNILKKDPEIVAKEIYKATLQAKNSNSDINKDARRVTKALLRNCTPEQSYKVAKIGQELEKLESKNGKSSFKDNLRTFAKSVASIFNSKYKVREGEVAQAVELVKNLDRLNKKLFTGVKRENPLADKSKGSESKMIFGKFTEKIVKASDTAQGKNGLKRP
jgi:hypothetical protein